MNLTARQKACFDFIRAEICARGVPPSFAEIGEHLGVQSKSNVHRFIGCLEERGVIRRIPGKARAIEVIEVGKQIDALAFLDPFTVEMVRSQARRQQRKPEQVIADICRRHFLIGEAA